MNHWKEVWQKKGNDFSEKEDIFEMFCELKKANGFDVAVGDGYYENFWKSWEVMREKMEGYVGKFKSVYEVGCGSGVNLYLFRELCGVTQLGGMDYSKSLVEIANSVLGGNIVCKEAIQLEEEPKYDVVLSSSAFQYFESEEYALAVLEKMFNKASRMVVVTELNDIDKKEALYAHRRSMIEDYDTRYEGLDKTFFSKEKLKSFAKCHNYKIHIVNPPENESYWNNDYFFDCYFIKE